MKTTILADGTLSIKPESELEAYALGKWCERNLDWRVASDASPPQMIIDCSQYPAAIAPLRVPA
ncbi:hypothetical protein [Paraburkholderia phenoliruptrix]|uniref:hypothetical protein n=1 Tax=Paraburkholderia phenoliruptrix TaxID=252970 RepID=UPI001C6ECAF6|nr:hypothetical protein [Paraburkholderia phenoliruptrix]MBW9102928.1 hypothetical protein [Paraburkholderia phenoliruptrix]MBW9132902.1 hypothetical protein [Paraburkholderia ginsengiterrae]